MGSAPAAASPARSALPPLRLPVNATATATGRVVHALCQWGLLIALARLGSPELLGQFALGLAVAGPVMLLAGLQLRAVQVTDAADRSPFSEYLALRLTTSAGALIVIGVVAFLVGGRTAGTAVILLVGLLKAIDSVSDVYRGAMQRAERMERVAGSMILRGTSSLAGFSLALFLGAPLPVALAVVVLVSLLTWRTWDVWNMKRLTGEGFGPPSRARALFGTVPAFDSRTLVALARLALPLGVVAVLLSLTTYAPQWAVRSAGGDAALGLFAAVLLLAMAGGLPVKAVAMSASPRLARLYEAGDAIGFRQLYRKLLAVAGSVGIGAFVGAAVLGAPLLDRVYGPEYGGQAGLLLLLCAVAALVHLVSVQGYAVTAARRFRGQVPVSVVVAATTLSSAFILVPHFGSTGAAVAMLAGAAVQGVGYTLLLRGALGHLDRAPTGGPHRAHA